MCRLKILRFQSGYFGLKKNDDWIDELLHSLSLMDKADNNMRTLSGGMKRRVMVAQALVHKPPVIVLDEPTAGVDVELRQTLWKFIAGLNQKGHTILLTTHYLEEAETLCNRIAMLKAISTNQPKVVFLAYPNNPTGVALREAEIVQIIEATPGLVVVDEAYEAFADASFMARVLEFPNVLVLRS